MSLSCSGVFVGQDFRTRKKNWATFNRYIVYIVYFGWSTNVYNFVEKVSFVCGILPIHANVQVVVGVIVVVVVVVMVKVVEVVVVLVPVVDF